MRESQMKKLVALAVVSAFAAPIYAADITISGDQEFSYVDANGATSTAIDGDFNIKASTSTANGLKISADINITDEAGDDGGNSLTIAGPFGSIDLGDTSSAADAYDDRTDYSLVTGVGVTAPDAAIGYTLPSMIPNLSVYLSTGADTNEDGEAHTGIALQYKAGPLSVAYGQNQNDDESKITYVGGTVTLAGIAVSLETTEDNATGAKAEERNIGVKYSMGDLTLFAAVKETQTNDIAQTDATAVGLHYSLGGGVVAFLESSSDSMDASADTTAVGMTFKF